MSSYEVFLGRRKHKIYNHRGRERLWLIMSEPIFLKPASREEVDEQGKPFGKASSYFYQIIGHSPLDGLVQRISRYRCALPSTSMTPPSIRSLNILYMDRMSIRITVYLSLESSRPFQVNSLTWIDSGVNAPRKFSDHFIHG